MSNEVKSTSTGKAVRLGDLLVQKGLITERQLQEALDIQKKEGKFLGETLIEHEFAPSHEVYKALSEQLDMPYVDLNSIADIDISLLQIVPEKFARRFTILPLAIERNMLTVAVTDQLDLMALDNISSSTGYPVHSVLADRKLLEEAIDREYKRLSNIEEGLDELLISDEFEPDTEDEEEEDISESELEAEAQDAPVVRFVSMLIQQTISKGASDLHIEPREKNVEVRARIDGVLHNLNPPTKEMFPAVLSRIKIISGLDISERRLPQDGRCKLKGKNIDLRVSTLPTIYGEKVVMRVLDKSSLSLGLEQLGFEPEQKEAFEKGLHSPQGVILNTGPTGSGKTTTLYSGLNYVQSGDTNIITVEDPVEYELHGINQVQVKSEIGFTFASALRSILRQDPDIVMVGEIRDLETVEIAVRAALTGHLVLSTLHTNSAVATITRMKDMGVQPYMLGTCLNIIMAQRLVRRICSECKAPLDVPDSVREELGIEPDVQLYKGTGCNNCMNTGYSGRVGIYELMKVSKNIAEAISRDAPEAELLQMARQEGMITLYECGVRKIIQGHTTPEEIMTRTVE